jgi:hypothetical protein
VPLQWSLKRIFLDEKATRRACFLGTSDSGSAIAAKAILLFTYEESRSETFLPNCDASLRRRVGHEGSAWAVQQVAVKPAYSRPYRDEALFFLKAPGGLCFKG